MNSDSKIFVGLRPIRKPARSAQATSSPKCQWDGCEGAGLHRAPVGRDGEGLYLLFCAAHVKDYGKGYNFATNLSDPVIARYQREAASGARPTVGHKTHQPAEAGLPFTIRSGSAKAVNARKNAADQRVMRAAQQQRKLKVLEAKAFEALGLLPEATPEEIKSSYKQKLKMHHPDANRGDRNSEEYLQAAISAYKILKINGFC